MRHMYARAMPVPRTHAPIPPATPAWNLGVQSRAHKNRGATHYKNLGISLIHDEMEPAPIPITILSP